MSRARIAASFQRAQRGGRAAFMPYLTLGYPTPAAAVEAARGCLAGGADLLELGIPFSDPLADGPLLQAAAQQALSTGVTVEAALEMVAHVRRMDPRVPLVLLVYANTVASRGVARFAREAAEAGADGLILPDWPPDEAGNLLPALEERDLAYVGLVTPVSSTARIARVAAVSAGFLYAVSVTGVTGERRGLSEELAPLARRCRRVSSLPVAAGFGIGRPEDARTAAGICDGVIVGSALARRLGEAGPGEAEAVARSFTRSFRDALERRDRPAGRAAGVAGGALEPPGGREWV